MKYTLFSVLILSIVMLYWANKMLEIKNNLEKKVLGSYYSQMEEINNSTGLDVYNLENLPNYKEVQELNNASSNIPEKIK